LTQEVYHPTTTVIRPELDTGRDREETFAGMLGNDKVAPIPDLPAIASE
jgi:hypothetical protein